MPFPLEGGEVAEYDVLRRIGRWDDDEIFFSLFRCRGKCDPDLLEAPPDQAVAACTGPRVEAPAVPATPGF